MVKKGWDMEREWEMGGGWMRRGGGLQWWHVERLGGRGLRGERLCGGLGVVLMRYLVDSRSRWVCWVDGSREDCKSSSDSMATLGAENAVPCVERVGGGVVVLLGC